MTGDAYTPGHSQNATDFMAKRSLQSHGAFFVPHLVGGLSVLDCGCGPGSITLGIACVVSPGKVVGVDFGASQIERAGDDAAAATFRSWSQNPSGIFAQAWVSCVARKRA